MISEKIPVVYLIGSGHCGSTLLDMLMSAHSKIVGVGELHSFSTKEEDLKKLVCTCQKNTFECSFWRCVKDKITLKDGLSVYRKKLDFLLNKRNYVFNNEKRNPVEIRSYLEINEKIYENILKCSKKEIVFDSSKEVNRGELLLLSKKLNIVLLHLVRDGRGVMWSYKRKYGGSFSPMWRWLGLNLKCEIIKRRNNAKVIFSRYEDLVRNPEEELKRILKEIGLSFEPQMLNFMNLPQHQLAGNRLRFQREIKIKEDLSWKENLSFWDKVIFSILGGWLNKIYGYNLRGV